jgi:hypothetical protein
MSQHSVFILRYLLSLIQNLQDWLESDEITLRAISILAHSLYIMVWK